MTCNGPTKNDCIKCQDDCTKNNNECICPEDFPPADDLSLLTCVKNTFIVPEESNQSNLPTSGILICICILASS